MNVLPGSVHIRRGKPMTQSVVLRESMSIGLLLDHHIERRRSCYSVGIVVWYQINNPVSVSSTSFGM